VQKLKHWASDPELIEEDVVLLLLGISTTPEDASQYCRNNSVPSSIIHGSLDSIGETLLSDVYGVDSVPHQIIVDRDGIVLLNGDPVDLGEAKELLRKRSSGLSAQISPQGTPSLSPSHIVMKGEASMPKDMYNFEMTLKATKHQKIGRRSRRPVGGAAIAQ
jgi:hypothetical protein